MSGERRAIAGGENVELLNKWKRTLRSLAGGRHRSDIGGRGEGRERGERERERNRGEEREMERERERRERDWRVLEAKLLQGWGEKLKKIRRNSCAPLHCPMLKE